MAALDPHDEINHPPCEWTNSYFDLLARCLPGMTEPEIDDFALAPITTLPDEPFFDAATLFLRNVRGLFNDRGLHEREAVHIWVTLASRLVTSSG